MLSSTGLSICMVYQRCRGPSLFSPPWLGVSAVRSPGVSPQPAAASAAGSRRPAQRGPAAQGQAQPQVADVPRRRQLGARGRDRLGPRREAGGRPHAGRLRGDRGRQAADGRDLQARHGRRDPETGRRRSPADPHRVRRGVGSRARRRAAVRHLPGRLPRAPDVRSRREARADRVRPEAARRPPTSCGDHVSADARQRRPDDAKPGPADLGDPALRGAQVRLSAPQRVRGAVRPSTRRTSSSGSATRCRCRRSRRSSRTWARCAKGARR